LGRKEPLLTVSFELFLGRKEPLLTEFWVRKRSKEPPRAHGREEECGTNRLPGPMGGRRNVAQTGSLSLRKEEECGTNRLPGP